MWIFSNILVIFGQFSDLTVAVLLKGLELAGWGLANT
jgi:hypothetical protein